MRRSDTDAFGLAKLEGRHAAVFDYRAEKVSKMLSSWLRLSRHIIAMVEAATFIGFVLQDRRSHTRARACMYAQYTQHAISLHVRARARGRACARARVCVRVCA